MGAAGNLTLAIVGGLAIGTLFFFVMRSVRRLERPPERERLRVEAVIIGEVLPPQQRKEIER